jgi:hypothetical protein
MGYEYLLVLFTGAVLAVPLSIYGLNEWLSGFAYHVNISPLSYALHANADRVIAHSYRKPADFQGQPG